MDFGCFCFKRTGFTAFRSGRNVCYFGTSFIEPASFALLVRRAPGFDRAEIPDAHGLLATGGRIP